jgi:hypothetical protein
MVAVPLCAFNWIENLEFPLFETLCMEYTMSPFAPLSKSLAETCKDNRKQII